MVSFRTRLARIILRLGLWIDPSDPIRFTLHTRRLNVTLEGEADTLVHSITDVVSGGIGGKVGLGFQRPPGCSDSRY